MSEVLPDAPAGLVPGQPAHADVPAQPKPRLRPINRDLCSPSSMDQLVAADHLVRLVWAYVQELDLTDFYADIRSVEGRPGRDATDPAQLVALWLYATLDGVTSALRLDELCRDCLPYQWLRGGVSLNYHTLSDFRVANLGRLNQLFSDTIACFHQEGLISLERTAQDGLKVRACAGEDSYRREGALQKALAQAQEYLQQLQEQQDGSAGKRQQAARKRAASERVGRLKGALKALEQIKRERQERDRQDEKEKQKEPRASMTDPEARKMKMPDGGYRLAYNVQLNTEVGAGVIVGVAVSTEGNDHNEMLPMLGQMQERYDKVPKEHLVDGGFVNKGQITQAEQEHHTTVYAPLQDEKKQLEGGKDPDQKKRGDTPEVAAWRQRMGSPEGKEVYKRRASTAEWANAQARNRGLYQLKVRGAKKVLAVILWYALAHNLMRALALRAAKAAKAQTDAVATAQPG